MNTPIDLNNDFFFEKIRKNYTKDILVNRSFLLNLLLNFLVGLTFPLVIIFTLLGFKKRY